MKGIHNIKAGVTYQQTFLTENDTFGIVDPTFNAPCLDADGTPVQVRRSLRPDANALAPLIAQPCAEAIRRCVYSAPRLLRPDPDRRAAGLRRLPCRADEQRCIPFTATPT